MARAEAEECNVAVGGGEADLGICGKAILWSGGPKEEKKGGCDAG